VWKSCSIALQGLLPDKLLSSLFDLKIPILLLTIKLIQQQGRKNKKNRYGKHKRVIVLLEDFHGVRKYNNNYFLK